MKKDHFVVRVTEYDFGDRVHKHWECVFLIRVCWSKTRKRVRFWNIRLLDLTNVEVPLETERVPWTWSGPRVDWLVDRLVNNSQSHYTLCHLLSVCLWVCVSAISKTLCIDITLYPLICTVTNRILLQLEQNKTKSKKCFFLFSFLQYCLFFQWWINDIFIQAIIHTV